MQIVYTLIGYIDINILPLVISAYPLIMDLTNILLPSWFLLWASGDIRNAVKKFFRIKTNENETWAMKTTAVNVQPPALNGSASHLASLQQNV